MTATGPTTPHEPADVPPPADDGGRGPLTARHHEATADGAR
ncbi:hypothetical protein [Streptomyces sp. NPDC059247]